MFSYFYDPMFPLIKIFTLLTVSFILAISLTPLLANFLYKYKLSKKIRNSGRTPIYTKLHQHKAGVPTMGGILIWGTVLILAVLFGLLAKLNPIFSYFNFLSRRETLLPLGALIASALVGLLDDFLDLTNFGKDKLGVRFRYKILLYAVIAGFGAGWFYFKLDWNTIHLPFLGEFVLGPLFILFFILIIISTSFAVNETDGLDGLAGGVLLTCFVSFGAIAFYQGKYNLAVFCAVIIGALLAFLWFNIPPARFFMGDTGSMSLGVVLGIIAFLTKASLFLPIIGFVLMIEALSYLLQVFAKKYLGRKIFLSSPLHHHLEASGWPEPKIVMRFWVISMIAGVIGLILVLIDKTM